MAPDDPWLDALGAVAREEAAEAEAPLPPSGPLRPLETDERAAVLEAVLETIAAGRGAGVAAEDALPGPSTPLAEVAAPSPPRRWGWAAAVGAAVLAASIALMVWPGGSTLPAYTVEATAGAATVRGDDPPADGVAVYTAGTRFRLVLRPAADVEEPVGVVVALRGPDGPVDWRPPIAVGDSGSVKVEGVFAGPLALPPGVYRATFTLSAGGGEGRVVEHRFRVAPAERP